MAAFNTFVKKQEAVAFPKEPFYLRYGPSAEEEESPGGEQVFMELPFNDRGQGIDAIYEIGPAADDVNADERTGISVSKHSAPP